MKYLTYILGLIILAGAGCTTTPKKTDASIERFSSDISGFSDTKNLTTEELFKTASTDAGFHIYYPTFVPDGLILDHRFTWDKKSVIILLITPFDPAIPAVTGVPTITINEHISSETPNKITQRISELESKEEIKVNGNIGYFGYYTMANLKFNTVIFSTKDGVDIGIWSRTYDKDTLLQIAKSMK